MSSVLETELASDVRYKTNPALDDASKVLLSHKKILLARDPKNQRNTMIWRR